MRTQTRGRRRKVFTWPCSSIPCQRTAPFGPPLRTSSQQRPRVAASTARAGRAGVVCVVAGLDAAVDDCVCVDGGVAAWRGVDEPPRREARRPPTPAITRTTAATAPTARSGRRRSDRSGAETSGSSAYGRMRELYSSR
jgi:hypothetical protein